MDAVESFYELVDKGRKGMNTSLSIGLPRMEAYIEGLSQGSHILIGANSGSGKTTLLLYSYIYKPIMENNTEKDVRYIYMNLEMSQEQILAKLLSIYVYEHYGKILTFKEIFSRGKNTILSDENYELIVRCRPILEMFKERIIFHDGALTADKFDSLVIEDLKQFGTFEGDNYIPNNPNQIVCIVIDHISLVRASKGRSKKEEMDIISNHCVSFRNKCKIITPIILMQMNRNQFGNERLKNEGLREPDVSDLKDSGTMLEDTQIALLMFNPVQAKLATHRGYDIKTLGDNYRSLKCVKNRFGQSEVAVGLAFYGGVGIFKELPPSSQIADYDQYKDPSWNLSDKREDLSSKSDTDEHVNLTIVL